jgi:hypothetical protein
MKLQEDLRNPGTRIAIMKGTAAPAGHRVSLEELSVLQPVRRSSAAIPEGRMGAGATSGLDQRRVDTSVASEPRTLRQEMRRFSAREIGIFAAASSVSSS